MSEDHPAGGSSEFFKTPRRKPVVKIDNFVRKHTQAVEVEKLNQMGLTTINFISLSKINQLISLAVLKAFEKYQRIWNQNEALKIQEEVRAEIEKQFLRKQAGREALAEQQRSLEEDVEELRPAIESRVLELAAEKGGEIGRWSILCSEEGFAELERLMRGFIARALEAVAHRDKVWVAAGLDLKKLESELQDVVRRVLEGERRPLELGVIKGSSRKDKDYEENLQAAKDLVHHAIQLTKPRKDELIYGVMGVPAQASINNKEAIIEAAKEELDAVMLCSEPFAVAYGLDMLDDVLVIDIGAGTTDLCRMYGAMPSEEDQITLNCAGDFIDQNLYRLMVEKCQGADFNINMVKRIKEKYGFVNTIAQPVSVELPVRGKPTPFDITGELRSACRLIIPEIVDAIHNLIASFDPEFQDRLRSNVLLAGGGSQTIGLGLAIEQELKEKLGGAGVTTVEEPIYAGANGALKIAHDMPEEYWKKLR